MLRALLLMIVACSAELLATNSTWSLFVIFALPAEPLSVKLKERLLLMVALPAELLFRKPTSPVLLMLKMAFPAVLEFRKMRLLELGPPTSKTGAKPELFTIPLSVNVRVGKTLW